jgi:ribosomal protein S18 acetylase RimI-like enzyme
MSEIVEVPFEGMARELIGKFRLEVWRLETRVDESLFPDGEWIEALDLSARHWAARIDGKLVGAARLTIHSTLADNPDGYLWIRNHLSAPAPVGHLCKLVVSREARGLGIGRKLNEIRIQAAREMGAKSIIVTASDRNAQLLEKSGFFDTGIRETFPNRPEFPFRGLQLNF